MSLLLSVVSFTHLKFFPQCVPFGHQATSLSFISLSTNKEIILIVIRTRVNGAGGKESVCQCRIHEMWVQSLGQEDPLKEEMATYSSILVRRIPWTEKPRGLQSIGSQRVGHN